MLLPKPRRMRLGKEAYAQQKKQIFDRAGWRCAKCGRLAPLQRDHIRKRSQLGGDEDDNAQALCAKCHDEKDNVARSKSEYWK